MREIKFRLYTQDYGMLQVRRLQGDDITFPKYIQCKTPKGVKQFPRAIKNLMQYTGLKDKNGKEIYEGDIIGLQGYNSHKIGFKDGCFVAVPLDKIQEINWKHHPISSYPAYEVIGNIYENSELLEAK